MSAALPPAERATLLAASDEPALLLILGKLGLSVDEFFDLLEKSMQSDDPLEFLEEEVIALSVAKHVAAHAKR